MTRVKRPKATELTSTQKAKRRTRAVWLSINPCADADDYTLDLLVVAGTPMEEVPAEVRYGVVLRSHSLRDIQQTGELLESLIFKPLGVRVYWGRRYLTPESKPLHSNNRKSR